jgi:tripartite-type tricarboxylate transporter receptor subunit TctC
MTFVPIAAAVPAVNSGRLRPLGVTGAARSAALPAVPTISEAGVPGYEATSWNALWTPGATPRDIVLKVHSALAESLRATRVKEIFVSSGAEAAGSSPDDLARFLRDEIVKWGAVVRAAGIKPE